MANLRTVQGSSSPRPVIHTGHTRRNGVPSPSPAAQRRKTIKLWA